MTSFAVLTHEVYSKSNIKHLENANFDNYQAYSSPTLYIIILTTLITVWFSVYGKNKDLESKSVTGNGSQNSNDSLLVYLMAKKASRVKRNSIQREQETSWVRAVSSDFITVVKVHFTIYSK